MFFSLYDIVEQTFTNGPGNRFGIWLQGCDRNCEGCFNQETHDQKSGKKININTLVRLVKKESLKEPSIEGISISGGEPFLQLRPLYAFLKRIKSSTNLSVLIYTGYSLEELYQFNLFLKTIPYIDILIDGPYINNCKSNHPLLSSTNQRIHLLSERYSLFEISDGNCEYIIHQNGAITITGNYNETIT